jgi:hypothetical protein
VENAKAGSAAGTRPQSARNLAARDIARVQHAPDAVRTFPRKCRLASRVAIERHTPLHELAHVPRPFVDQQIHGRLIAQPRAGGKRIGQMQFG